jgi:hypothetical protein
MTWPGISWRGDDWITYFFYFLFVFGIRKGGRSASVYKKVNPGYFFLIRIKRAYLGVKKKIPYLLPSFFKPKVEKDNLKQKRKGFDFSLSN